MYILCKIHNFYLFFYSILYLCMRRLWEKFKILFQFMVVKYVYIFHIFQKKITIIKVEGLVNSYCY